MSKIDHNIHAHTIILQGAQEVFKELPHEFVSPDSLEDVVKNGGGCGFSVHAK